MGLVSCAQKPEQNQVSEQEQALKQEGFYSLEEYSQKPDNISVALSETTDQQTIKITKDGQELQVLKAKIENDPFWYLYDDKRNYSRLIHFIDANFDGYTDIYIGEGEFKSVNSLFLWNSNKGLFERYEQCVFQCPIFSPSEKAIYSYGGNAYVSEYFKDVWKDGELETQEIVSFFSNNETIDIESYYAEYGERRRKEYGFYECVINGDVENRRLIMETDNTNELPNNWPELMLKAFGEDEGYVFVSNLQTHSQRTLKSKVMTTIRTGKVGVVDSHDGRVVFNWVDAKEYIKWNYDGGYSKYIPENQDEYSIKPEYILNAAFNKAVRKVKISKLIPTSWELGKVYTFKPVLQDDNTICKFLKVRAVRLSDNNVTLNGKNISGKIIIEFTFLHDDNYKNSVYRYNEQELSLANNTSGDDYVTLQVDENGITYSVSQNGVRKKVTKLSDVQGEYPAIGYFGWISDTEIVCDHTLYVSTENISAYEIDKAELEREVREMTETIPGDDGSDQTADKKDIPAGLSNNMTAEEYLKYQKQ